MQGSRIALVATVVTLSGTVALESLQQQRDVDVMTAAAENFQPAPPPSQRVQLSRKHINGPTRPRLGANAVFCL